MIVTIFTAFGARVPDVPWIVNPEMARSNEVDPADQENAVRLYAWRLRDHAGSVQYRHIARRIHRCTEHAACPEWTQLLCTVALVETHERGPLVRAAEWTLHTLAFGRSGLTLGPFQLTNSP